MLIPVLLSTFGVVLRGIDSGYYYPRPKIPFPDSICPPRTTGTFPYCEEFPTHLDCDEGFTGKFPDCIKEQKCRHPEIGTYPDCFLPPCPPGYSIGTYPKCKRPSNELKCPLGSTGVFPDCEIQYDTPKYLNKATQAPHHTLQVTPIPDASSEPTLEGCGMGYTGTFPDCKLDERCRHPEIGTYPDCFLPPCPPGYSIGPYPNCKRPSNELKCPLGSTGVFPDCELEFTVRTCPEGTMCDVIPTPSIDHQSSQPPSTEHPITTVFDKMGWEDFKRIFNKTYANEMEEKKRQQIFARNQATIEAHNKLFEQGIETYSLATNEFTDRTYDEYLGVVGVDQSKSASNQNEFRIYSVNGKLVDDLKAVRVANSQ